MSDRKETCSPSRIRGDIAKNFSHKSACAVYHFHDIDCFLMYLCCDNKKIKYVVDFTK